MEGVVANYRSARTAQRVDIPVAAHLPHESEYCIVAAVAHASPSSLLPSPGATDSLLPPSRHYAAAEVLLGHYSIRKDAVSAQEGCNKRPEGAQTMGVGLGPGRSE